MFKFLPILDIPIGIIPNGYRSNPNDLELFSIIIIFLNVSFSGARDKLDVTPIFLFYPTNG